MVEEFIRITFDETGPLVKIMDKDDIAGFEWMIKYLKLVSDQTLARGENTNSKKIKLDLLLHKNKFQLVNSEN